MDGFEVNQPNAKAMKMAAATILLFGDVVCEKLPALRNLFSTAQSRPQLAQFLQAATDAIKRECALLPPHERFTASEFDDLLQLGEWHSTQDHPDVLIATTLLGVVQLGEYLV